MKTPLQAFDFELPNFTELSDGIDLQLQLPDDFESEPAQAKKRKKPADEIGIDSNLLTLRRRSAGRVILDLAAVRAAADHIRELPGDEETIHAIMGGDYHGWSIVPAIHRLAGIKIDELIVATLGFNNSNIADLCEMLDGGLIDRASILCSHFFKNSDPATYQYAKSVLTARGQVLGFTRNHAKLLLLKIGHAHYVVESSANLRSCNNLEQFTLTQSRPLYDFHAGWILSILKTVPE